MKGLEPLLKKISRQRILVIGDVMLDHYIWGDATRISPEAPVPVVNIKEFRDSAGGAANVAVNLANLGATTGLLSLIGEDKPGDDLLKKLLVYTVMMKRAVEEESFLGALLRTHWFRETVDLYFDGQYEAKYREITDDFISRGILLRERGQLVTTVKP